MIVDDKQKVVKIVLPLKSIYRLNVISIKITASFLKEILKLILQIKRKFKRSRIFENKIEYSLMNLSDLHYLTSWLKIRPQKSRHCIICEVLTNRLEIDPNFHCQLNLVKLRQFNEESTVFSPMILHNLEWSGKNEAGSLPHIIHTN